MNCKAYLALGSNLGDREKNLKAAVGMISELTHTCICNVSHIYETEPVGNTEQGYFLNMAVSVQTQIPPEDLLDKLQEIELQLKRTREIHWGPRTMDIDILLYGDLTLDMPRLKIPHPRMFERAFVLIPLKDIFLNDIIYGRDIGELINDCKDKNGVKLYRRWDCG